MQVLRCCSAYKQYNTIQYNTSVTGCLSSKITKSDARDSVSFKGEKEPSFDEIKTNVEMYKAIIFGSIAAITVALAGNTFSGAVKHILANHVSSIDACINTLKTCTLPQLGKFALAGSAEATSLIQFVKSLIKIGQKEIDKFPK